VHISINTYQSTVRFISVRSPVHAVRGCSAVRFESVRFGVRFARFGSAGSGLMRGSVRFGGVRFGSGGSGCSTGSVRFGFCHDAVRAVRFGRFGV
jgi:hypothetical protein